MNDRLIRNIEHEIGMVDVLIVSCKEILNRCTVHDFGDQRYVEGQQSILTAQRRSLKMLLGLAKEA